MTSSTIIRSAVETRAAHTNCDTIKSNYRSQRPPAADKTGIRRERTTVLRVRRNLWTDKLFLLSSSTFPLFYKRRANYWSYHLISPWNWVGLFWSSLFWFHSFLMSFANCILYLGIYFCSLFYFTKIIICLFFSLSFHLEIITIRTGSRRLWTSRVTRDID